jgi:hypothetical protein
MTDQPVSRLLIHDHPLGESIVVGHVEVRRITMGPTYRPALTTTLDQCSASCSPAP